MSADGWRPQGQIGGGPAMGSSMTRPAGRRKVRALLSHSMVWVCPPGLCPEDSPEAAAVRSGP